MEHLAKDEFQQIMFPGNLMMENSDCKFLYSD